MRWVRTSRRSQANGQPPFPSAVAQERARLYSPKASLSPSVIHTSEEGENDASSEGSEVSRGSRATSAAGAKKLAQFSSKDVDRLKTKLESSDAENWITRTDFIESVEDVSDEAAVKIRG